MGPAAPSNDPIPPPIGLNAQHIRRETGSPSGRDVPDTGPFPPPRGQPVRGLGPPGSGIPVAPTTPWWARRFGRLPTAAWLILLFAAAIAVAFVRSDSDRTDDAANGSALPTTEPGIVATATPSTIATSSTTTSSTTTSSTTTSSTTTSSTTTSSTTTTPPTSSTTPPTSTTTPPTSTIPGPLGAIVTISGRRGPCRFGTNCLIAGFTTSGFPTPPQTFICEFADGSRYPFQLKGLTEVSHACVTDNSRDSITIEVDGARSPTLTTAEVP